MGNGRAIAALKKLDDVGLIRCRLTQSGTGRRDTKVQVCYSMHKVSGGDIEQLQRMLGLVQASSVAAAGGGAAGDDAAAVAPVAAAIVEDAGFADLQAALAVYDTGVLKTVAAHLGSTEPVPSGLSAKKAVIFRLHRGPAQTADLEAAAAAVVSGKSSWSTMSVYGPFAIAFFALVFSQRRFKLAPPFVNVATSRSFSPASRRSPRMSWSTPPFQNVLSWNSRALSGNEHPAVP